MNFKGMYSSRTCIDFEVIKITFQQIINTYFTLVIFDSLLSNVAYLASSMIENKLRQI